MNLFESLEHMIRNARHEQVKQTAVASAIWALCQQNPSKTLTFNMADIEKATKGGGLGVIIDPETNQLQIKAFSKEEAEAMMEKQQTQPDTH